MIANSSFQPAVNPVSFDEVPQVVGEVCAVTLSDDRVKDEERYVLLRRWAFCAAVCKARDHIPSDQLRQLFQGICDFCNGVDDFNQGELTDSVNCVVLYSKVPLKDRIWIYRRIICRLIDDWFISLHGHLPVPKVSS